jgi:hypothetical protein
MQKKKHPVSIYSVGGIYGLKKEPDEVDNKPYNVYGNVMAYGNGMTMQETPNTQTALFKYPDGKFEVRGRFTNLERTGEGIEVGNLFYGTEGWLEISAETWRAFRQKEKTPFAGSKNGAQEKAITGLILLKLYVQAGARINGEINEGFFSTCLPHLANILLPIGSGSSF